MSYDVGHILQDKYRLVSLLGEGGMASVFEAEHTVIGRRVAVKLLHARLTDDPTARARMIREAKVAGSLGHPNVVDVQDVGTTDDGGVYIVMEKLEGCSLGELLKAETRLSTQRAVAITKQLCKGLQAAHDKGTVHRDLKPDNVFLIPGQQGDVERVKILDFGISKLSTLTEDEGLTRDGLLVGTPHYMAPEHAEGSQHVDHRSDLWSVGVILYVMLTGELPFPGDNYNAILANVLFKEPPPLREMAPDTPLALEAIVDKALARKPAERYQAATELLADLDRLPSTSREQTAPSQAPALSVAGSDPQASDTLSEPAADYDSDSGAAGNTGAHDEAAPTPVPELTDRFEQDTHISVWEHVVTLALLVPLSWLMWLPAWRTPPFLYYAFGLDESWGANLARLLLAGFVAGITLLGVTITYAIRKALLRRWPQGLWHLVLPVTLAGFSVYLWRTFTDQRATQLAALELCSIIDDQQAQEIAVGMSSSQARLCLALAAMGILVWLLASRVLVRDLFSGTWRRKAIHDQAAADDSSYQILGRVPISWLPLAGGLLLILVAELLVFPKWLPVIGQLPGQEGTGGYRTLTYLTWLACGAAIIKARTAGEGGASLARRTWLVGLVAAAGLTAAGFAIAHARLHALVGAPPGLRSVADDAMRQLLQANRGSLGGLITHMSLLLVLFALLRVAAGNLLPRRIRPVHLGRALLSSAVVALVLVPLPLPTLASRSLDRVYLPLAFTQMHPVTLVPGEKPSVYLDKRPRDLVSARKPFWTTLTNRAGHWYRDGDLRKVLVGYKRCPVLLSRALGRAKKIVPARCVSGVEARHYCEALGMRLPTPAEWDAALGKVPLPRSRHGKLPTTAFQRGNFGEWTLHIVHGTPTIVVRGRGSSKRIPANLEADGFSQFVGFRCAYQLPR